ncbi:MAG: hypothetical protein ACRD19_15820, partial [Terriglobia bacterium]
WLHHVDSRQVIFSREPSSRALAFRAHFIDHGQTLGGGQWELRDWKASGVYRDHQVYSMNDFAGECAKTIEIIDSLSAADLRRLPDGIPAEWFAEGDRAALAELLQQLDRRRSKLRYLVQQNSPLAAFGCDTAPSPAKRPPRSQMASGYRLPEMA